MKINDKIFIIRIAHELVYVKEWNEDKQMWYDANYTFDEMKIFFNVDVTTNAQFT